MHLRAVSVAGGRLCVVRAGVAIRAWHQVTARENESGELLGGWGWTELAKPPLS